MIRLTRAPIAAFKLGGLLMFAMLLCWTPRAFGAATNCTSGGGTLNLPSVTVPQNPAVGSLLGTAASTTVTFTCSNLPSSAPSAPNNYSLTATIQAGNLAKADSTNNPNGGNGIVFATNLPGIALRLTASPVQASDKAGNRGGPGSTRGFEPGAVTAPRSAWECVRSLFLVCLEYGGTYTNSVSETFTAQLIVTGPVTAGTLSSITLMQFNWYVYGLGASQGYFANLTLNSTTVNAPACSVVRSDTPVQLPTIFSSALDGAGTTSGPTGFNVQLNCQSGTRLAITLDASNKISTAAGVITNKTGAGYAGNVGVQILGGDGNPIIFGTPINEGTTTNGMMNLPFSARYYQTGAGITGGQVYATATYTLTYP